MPTAYVTLGGGLGNQLFQAAFGVMLQEAFGAEVVYIDDDFQFDRLSRRLLLPRFGGLKFQTISRLQLAGLPLVREADYAPQSYGALFELHPRIAFEGYWQNERFFLGPHEAIRAALRLDVDADLARAGEALRARNTIGLHVRRGEYGFIGLASVAYYRNAIAQIRREIGAAPVVCFTDEPVFCAAVFADVPDLTVRTPDTADPLEDFHLLSQCAHHVIANSSFSWWAAWLGQTQTSIVYVPAPWSVADPAADPAPARWRKIEGAVRGP